MRKTLTILFGAMLLLGLLVQAASARTGTAVTIQGTLNFLQPEEEVLTVLEDTAGVLCPVGVGHAALESGDQSRGPHVEPPTASSGPC